MLWRANKNGHNTDCSVTFIFLVLFHLSCENLGCLCICVFGGIKIIIIFFLEFEKSGQFRCKFCIYEIIIFYSQSCAVINLSHLEFACGQCFNKRRSGIYFKFRHRQSLQVWQYDWNSISDSLMARKIREPHRNILFELIRILMYLLNSDRLDQNFSMGKRMQSKSPKSIPPKNMISFFV